MFSSLKDLFHAATEPVRAIACGAENFERLIKDAREVRRISLNLAITQGTQFVSACLIWASALPFDYAVKKNLLYCGKPALVLGFMYAMPLAKDFLECGRKELARQKNLQKLTAPEQRQP